MKKIGIVTHFHGSLNYGGVLQAFAMCRVLEQLGYSPEQIRFSMEEDGPVRTLLQTVRKLMNPVLVMRFTGDKLKQIWRVRALEGRRQGFRRFNEQNIPSTCSVYNSRSIAQCESYDAYVAGSDQIWNPDDYFSAYFLAFAHQDKPRISYAASIGKSQLTPEQQEQFSRDLQGLTAVSVREKNAVELVQPLTSLPVEQVLDPTLLLEREQWEHVCGEAPVEQPYLFCFFLGYDPGTRRLAAEYARKHGLQIVTIPHASSQYTKGAGTWGDVRLWDASPSEFLSLVKHAACVFTDSFHACVFSTVFQKEFFVFHRAGHTGMSGRIESLLELFSCRERFCDTLQKQQLSYMEAQRPVNYEAGKGKLEIFREASLDYLKRNLSQGKDST